MPRLTYAITAMIGLETGEVPLCDVVETGAVRRYAQAIGDLDPMYMDREKAARSRFGEPVAPPLYPLGMIRLPFGNADAVELRAEDNAFDGATEMSTYGLPPLPLEGSPIVNGGVEVELLRYARHGERISLKARYKDIYERETTKGWMIFVVYQVQFLGQDRKPILSLSRTQIRR
jgi:uncharacterized protein